VGTHHRFICGDALTALRTLGDESVHCVVTSPPYFGLRDYGVDGQLGHGGTLDEYLDAMVEVFREVRRVLRRDGTLWLNLGDCYASGGRSSHADGRWKYGTARAVGRRPPVPVGLKPKDLIGVPWRVAFALQADGWWLRSDICWNKLNAIPESVIDRPTRSYEYIFLLSKSVRYWYDWAVARDPAVAVWNAIDMKRRAGSKMARLHDSGANIRVGAATRHLDMARYTRNWRNVWTVSTVPSRLPHFASFPPALVTKPLAAGCPAIVCSSCGSASCLCPARSTVPGVVLDPFGGSGTVSMVAKKMGRSSVYIDLNPEYVRMAVDRCAPWNQMTLDGEDTYEVSGLSDYVLSAANSPVPASGSNLR
jgi:DNA modification methylase